jgi:hypothetical protein
MITGALIEAFGEIAKELRAYAGSDFHKCLDVLESRIVRSIENAPIDGVPERDQLRLVEDTRRVVSAVFKDARSVGGG